MKFESKYSKFHTRNWICKCRRQNDLCGQHVKTICAIQSNWPSIIIAASWYVIYIHWAILQYNITTNTITTSFTLVIERFRNPTITETITVSEHPRVTSSLSLFWNAKPVKSCFETRARLVEFFTSKDKIIGLEIPLGKSICRRWGFGCTYGGPDINSFAKHHTTNAHAKHGLWSSIALKHGRGFSSITSFLMWNRCEHVKTKRDKPD